MPDLDAEFLGRLLDEHAAPLELFARQWCSTPEDIVQEALLQLMKQPALPSKIVPWLYRVVRNGAISASRSADRRKRHETLAGSQSEPWFATSAEAWLDGVAVSRALETLAIAEREVIVAHLWGGLSFDQIGEITASSSSTAHRRYEAGLARLRERMDVKCPRTS